MKIKTLFLLSGLVVFNGASSADAAILLSDDFTRATDGSLTGTDPSVGGTWTSFSGTSGEVQVTAGIVTLTDANSEDTGAAFQGGALNSGTIYYGFNVAVTDPGSYDGTDYEYFALLKNDASDFTSRLDVAAFSASGYRFGIAGSSGTADAAWGVDLDYGASYRVVVEFDFTSGVSTLFVNPTSLSSTSITSAADTVPELTQFAFRQSSASPDFTGTVDDLIVATSFNEAALVPEPSSLLLGALGALALIRRRR